MIAHTAGSDLAGPIGNERHPQPTFVKVTLLAPIFQARLGILVGRVYAARVLGRFEVIGAAVVAAEEDKRVSLDSQLLEQSQNFTHLSILHGDHGSVAPGLLGPGLVLVKCPGGVGVGDTEDAVGRRVGQVCEERLPGMLTDELHGRFVNDILRIGLTAGSAVIARERHLLAVADQIRRKVAVRVNLVVVAEEHVETVLFGHAGRVTPTAAPLAEPARGVAERLEHGGDSDLLGP